MHKIMVHATPLCMRTCLAVCKGSSAVAKTRCVMSKENFQFFCGAAAFT